MQQWLRHQQPGQRRPTQQAEVLCRQVHLLYQQPLAQCRRTGSSSRKNTQNVIFPHIVETLFEKTLLPYNCCGVAVSFDGGLSARFVSIVPHLCCVSVLQSTKMAHNAEFR